MKPLHPKDNTAYYHLVKLCFSQHLNLFTHFYFYLVPMLQLLHNVSGALWCFPTLLMVSDNFVDPTWLLQLRLQLSWERRHVTSTAAENVTATHQCCLLMVKRQWEITCHNDGGEVKAAAWPPSSCTLLSELSLYKGAQSFGPVSIAGSKQTWLLAFEWIFIDSCQ